MLLGHVVEPMGQKSPELSIVVSARNDDHGGNFMRRMQIFVTGLLEQAKRFQLDSELITVEWNPPHETPRLADAMAWPSGASPCSVRIIEVSPELHSRFRYSDRIHLFQMIAKNVGIRRARGRFILATNVDILFSDELMRFLTSQALEPRCMYRIDRYDVPADVPTECSVVEQLNYCRQNVIRVNGRDGTIDAATWKTREQSMIGGRRLLLPNRFYQLLGKALRHRALGYFSSPATTQGTWLRRLRKYVRPFYPSLHVNVCGDFTLLAREDWLSLRGYPELELHSMNLDSLFCYMAYKDGVAEKILRDPMRIYHIEHAPGWISQWMRKERLDALGIPMLTWTQLESWVMRMYSQRAMPLFNSEAWGLGFENLPEKRISSK